MMVHSVAQEGSDVPTENAVLGLIQRLEAAGEGSVILDNAIFKHLGEPLPDCFGPKKIELQWQDDGTAVMPVGEMLVRYTPAKYTTSLDAALALAERALPGWCWIADGGGKSPCTGVVIGEDEGDAPSPAFTGKAPTPALALCIAILKATTAAEGPSVGTQAEGRSDPK